MIRTIYYTSISLIVSSKGFKFLCVHTRNVHLGEGLWLMYSIYGRSADLNMFLMSLSDFALK